MTDAGGDRRRPERHEGPWTERVRFDNVPGDAPFAYRPNEVLTMGGDDALSVVSGLYPGAEVRGEVDRFLHLVDVPEPVELVHELRLHGHVAHPNHVFFAHGNGCGCCPPHPSTPCGEGASPMYGSPMYGHAAVYGSPMYGSPMYGHPMYGHAPHSSTARPAPADAPVAAILGEVDMPQALGSATVIVLDTGLAEGPFRPLAVEDSTTIRAASTLDGDQPDENGDDRLDPAAGHGTFIAGLVDQVAPGCDVTVHRVLSTFGDGDEAGIVHCLNSLEIDDPFHTIVNLSLGGYVLEHPYALARAVRLLQASGVVVVSSAGNDATCAPTYPAALPGVVGVGAIGPDGPAPFTNYGPWVRACAPGVDLLSCFFTNFNGIGGIGADGSDPDQFEGWALWSGTSFSAPVVVGALARMMRAAGCTGREAVARIIDAPALMRIPNLGTVVNVI